MSRLHHVLLTTLRPLVRPRGERGVTTAEYALLLALVVIVLISSLTSLGATLQDKLQSIIDTLTGVGP